MKPNSKNSITESKRPIVVDLFAGAGGLSLAFEQAGFDVAAAVEIDPIHCAIHHYNFPHSSTICASVVNLSGEDIRRRAEIGKREIDVLCGGAPCQGFSLMGRRALDDPRNQLVFHFVRLVRELRPKYFVFENVKGLTVGTHKRFLNEVVEEMKSAGYDILLPWQVLNAADFGVPQDRRRLFLIGARNGLPLPVYPQPTTRVTVKQAMVICPMRTNLRRYWIVTALKSNSKPRLLMRSVFAVWSAIQTIFLILAITTRTCFRRVREQCIPKYHKSGSSKRRMAKQSRFPVFSNSILMACATPCARVLIPLVARLPVRDRFTRFTLV